MDTAGPSRAAYEPRRETPGKEDDPQILLILVGLPGSGKSTFAEALVKSARSGSRGRRWVRASQDDAPSRRRQECEAVVRQGIAEGSNVVVDRVDFDPVQRSHFINIAYSLPPPSRPLILALIFSVSPETLQRRLEIRPDHPTLKDPETALRVLGQMQRDYRPPRAGDGEGFDGILELREDEQPDGGVWTPELLESVMTRCRTSPGDDGRRVPPVQPTPGMRGRGAYRGHRPYPQPRFDGRYAPPRPYDARGSGYVHPTNAYAPPGESRDGYGYRPSVPYQTPPQTSWRPPQPPASLPARPPAQ